MIQKMLGFSLLLCCFNLINAQQFHLLKFEKNEDNRKDCRIIGDCIADKFINNDTFNLILYFDNNCRDLSKTIDKVSFLNDTLNVKILDKNGIKFIKYNGQEGKNDTINSDIITLSRCNGGYDTRLGIISMVGFNKMPKVIQFNNRILDNCPTSKVKFDVFNNDTINIYDKDGQKEGLWIDFYDSGEIRTKKIYMRDGVKGYVFDKDGKIINHIIGEDCSGEIIEIKMKN